MEDIKERLSDYVRSITAPSAGANMYVCPLCGSGTGKHKTGAFSVQGTRWKCFACDRCGDIYDLIGALEGLDTFPEQQARAREIFGQEAPAKDPGIEAFLLEAARNLDKTDYTRGISRQTLERFGVGYAPHWKHPKRPRDPETPRLIIPTSNESYLARDTRAHIPEQDPPAKLKVGKAHIFNTQALYQDRQPVYIVEGEIDALSIIDVGGQALALGSAARVQSLLGYLEDLKPAKPLIISLDNDEAGEKASQTLSKGLKSLGIPFYRYNPAKGFKDANEALQGARDALTEAVRRGEEEAAEHIQAEAEAEREAYRAISAGACLAGFLDGIAAQVDTPAIPTGFPRLDEALDGGFYEGLYIIGGISSLGKTSLVLQVADQLAQQGYEVLVYSLEMARTELMAKSISRHTLQIALTQKLGIANAKTARGITTATRYQSYTAEEIGLIVKAGHAYKEYADRIYIAEGIGDIGAFQIREGVEKHLFFTGKTPIVIVDYLQILAPWSERATDKQNTDKAVLELKRISRDFKTPVIGISSFNRMNYNTPVTMEAFKESGAIEYSSDVLIGLQLSGVGKEGFRAEEAKQKNPREIELKILKNRQGRLAELEYSYYAPFNFFKES